MATRPDRLVQKRFTGWLERKVTSVLHKYTEVPIGGGTGPQIYGNVEPPYQRQFDPQWIYRLRQNSSLINNSIEEKVNQTFRRGWGDWEKAYEAKCPNCSTEFGSQAPFVEDFHPDDVDIDFSTERKCPECEEMVDFETPDDEDLERAKEFFEQANEARQRDSHLEPDDAPSISQTLMEVLREASWDVESFDDEWFLFNRAYTIDPEGRVTDYDLREVHRAPPERMRYVVDEDTGRIGGQYWVCVECREERGRDYSPEEEPVRCSRCNNQTYEVYAVSTEGPRGGEPEQYYIRGEFLQKSLYEPGKFYGYSPIVTLWDEARTLEKMDDWYREAYKRRRAPRGALAIRGQNSQSVRSHNKKQFEKMRGDPNHIPTLMDDGESEGDPIKFISLLESPADMQHMEMREWMKERISAKWGVTPIFQGSASESGLSQSLEIQVSNRAADRLRTIQNQVVDVVLAQLDIDGWTVEIAEVEEENEQEQIELQLKNLQAAQQAAQLGLDVEWTDEDRVDIKPGDVEAAPEDGQGMGGMDGLGGMLGDEGPDDGGPQMGEGPDEAAGPEDAENTQEAVDNGGFDPVDLGTTDGAGGMEPG